MEENRVIIKKKRRRRKKGLWEKLKENMVSVLQSKYFYIVIIIAIAWAVGRWIIQYTLESE